MDRITTYTVLINDEIKEMIFTKIYRITSERPKRNFAETEPKPKYELFTEPKPKLNTEIITKYYRM